MKLKDAYRLIQNSCQEYDVRIKYAGGEWEYIEIPAGGLKVNIDDTVLSDFVNFRISQIVALDFYKLSFVLFEV